MRRAALLLVLLSAGCTSRERSLRAAIRETYAAYEGSPDRYELGACTFAPLAGEDRKRFNIQYVLEPESPDVATCEITFYFMNFPGPGAPGPVRRRVQFVWLNNPSKWAPWW